MEDRTAAHRVRSPGADVWAPPQDAAADAAQLVQHIDGLRKAWSAKRGGAGLAAAVWDPGMGAFRVAVRNSAGPLLDSMGFTCGGEHYLHFEEALFLSDRGNLLMFDDATGRPGAAGKRMVSLQEAVHTMVCFGISVERYLVYSGLMRLGYIVRRHPARWYLEEGEHPADVWGATPAWAGVDCLEPPGPSGGPSASSSGEAGAGGGRDRPRQRRRRADAAPRADAQGSQQPCERGWWPPAPGWLPACALAAPPPPPPAAHAAADDFERLAQRHPRVRPLPSISSLLSPNPHTRPPDVPPLAGAAAQSTAAPDRGSACIAFDVYPPNAAFSRREPGEPLFALALPRPPPGSLDRPEDDGSDWGAFDDGSGGLPCLDELLSLQREAGGLPLRFAVVDGTEPCFFGVSSVDLLNMVPTGRHLAGAPRV